MLNFIIFQNVSVCCVFGFYFLFSEQYGDIGSFLFILEIFMLFDEFQDATVSTAVYPQAGSGSVLALSYVGLGLGEAGEVQGKLKKVIRDDAGVLSPAVRDAIAAELGDVLWYVARLATELGVSLDDVAAANLAKLESRANRGTLSGSGDDR